MEGVQVIPAPPVHGSPRLPLVVDVYLDSVQPVLPVSDRTPHQSFVYHLRLCPLNRVTPVACVRSLCR